MGKKLSFATLFIICLVFQSCPGCDDYDPLDEVTIESAKNGTLVIPGATGSGGGGGGSSSFKPGSMNVTCNNAGPNSTPNVHCFTVGSATAPHYYGSTSVFSGSNLVGTSWKNSIGCEMYLGSGGSGTFKPNATASVKSMKWGVLINKNGASAGGSTNLYVNMVESDYGDLIDAQFGAGVYYTGSGSWSNGWTKK